MRLTPAEIEAIVSAVRARDPAAEVRLFGSRVRDDARGGDIDLLILSETIAFREKIDILIDIKDKLGEQKIDLVLRKPTAQDAWLESIRSQSVKLT